MSTNLQTSPVCCPSARPGASGFLSHQWLEEDPVFPEIDRLRGVTGTMQVNIDQHRACAPGLDKLRRYAAGTDPRDYDAATLVALIDGFRSVLQRHLTNEVSTLLKLKDYDSGALLKMWRVAEKAAGMPPNFIDEVLPLVLGLSDRTCQGDIQDFPPVPWFLPYLVH